MQYLLTFATAESRNNFANKCGLATANSESIYIPLSLLAVAKADGSVESIAVDGAGEESFVIKTSDVSSIANITVEQTLDSDTYVVKTADPLSLYDAVNGKMDAANTPVKLMSELTGDSTTLSAEDAQWARIRISSRFRPFPSTFEKIDSDYKTKPEIYVIDSGIKNDHAEFTNVSGLQVVNFFKLDRFASYADNLGHGTAVASAAVGKNVGLQQYAKLMNVKTFDVGDKPNLLELGAAMDAILVRHQTTPNIAKVVNCSWLVPKSFYLEEKIQNLIDSGITVVAAAGNFNDNVANYTPAGMPNVITVASSDADDISAGFNNFTSGEVSPTNFGQVIDIFAPGVSVTVADNNGGYIRSNGTSLSAGYVTGAVAAIMSVAPSIQTPSSMINLLVKDSTKGVLLLDSTKFSSSQNRVVHLVDGNGELANYNDLDFYLGIFSGDVETISGDVNNISFGSTIDVFNHASTYSLVWEDTALQNKYGSYITLNSANGAFNIDRPTESLPAGQTIEIVKFKIKQSSTVGDAYSPNMFFFATDPSRDANYDYNTDIASALENINSQSYFAAWRGGAIK